MSYKVLEYSFDHLKNCFLEQAQAPEDVILAKRHLACFEGYFSHLEFKTIIVEENYVNRDFLEDYSSYYVRSFKEYQRNCIRLHFFKNVISPEDFESILKGEPNGVNIDDLQENYQGFMVLKPLPTTIIGKTCIATYGHDGRRYFPSVRNYKANLFGIPLSINSLAYQEQDSIVAACASSSIWTAFHGTAMLFQHALPSPVEITNWATKYFPFANRHFPNKGLSGEQMAIAIREVGLEPYLYNVRSYDTLKATFYAYLKGKIPVVLGFTLYDTQDPANPRFFGKHAVTITGFSLGDIATDSYELIANLKLHSSRIDKLYVHDDQIGPFAKMDFGGFNVNDKGKNIPTLETTWLDSNKAVGNIKAAPEILIIPLYHKIRIPYEAVLNSVNRFNALFIPFIGKLPNLQLFEWDIYLSDISDFKNDILKNENLEPLTKESLLIMRFPKYLWRAVGKIGDENKIEFLIDATDIDQGSSFIIRISYDKIIEKMCEVIMGAYDSKEMSDLTTKEIMESFQ